MSHRYAVLWTLDEPESLPIGLAVEQDGCVLVDLPEHYCVPARWRGEYRVLQPDSTRLTYRPGDTGYFDQVLLDLSRMFAIGQQDVVDAADQEAVLGLLNENVLRPLRQARVETYEPTYPKHRYDHVEEPAETAAASPSGTRIALVA